MELYENLRNLLIDPEKAKAEICSRYFYDFFVEFWDVIETVELIPNWHIKEICDQLQEVYEIWDRGEKQPDVLINVPPGSSKSTIVTQMFPAWLWTKNPKIRVISSSYSADLSVIHAVKTRDILKSEKYNRFYPGHIVFKSDTDGKTHYKNTQNGERFVTSTGGTVTGMHGDFILNDDPIKPMGAAGADSAALKNAETFITETLSSRKTNKKRTVTIMIMQRLHDKDPSGIWLKKKGKKLRHICLPATISNDVKPESLKAKYINGHLDPNRLGPDEIAEVKIDLGSRGYAGQYMENPTPEGGDIWKEDWFKVLPDHLFPGPEDMESYGTDWDTAYTEDQENDASAWVTSGRIQYNTYIDKAGYTRKELPELVKFMRMMPSPHYVEAKASGKSAAQVLKRLGITAIEVEISGKGDKIARTKIATPRVEAGFVFIRESLYQMLLHDEEQGLLRFPNGAHDDLNDAFTQAIQRHDGPSYGVGVA
jgi:predicted phage terminase large subunit-like protein